MAQLAMPKPSVDHLMDTPLQQLVEELHVELKESCITDPGFTGYLWSDNRGIVVALPPGRSELEHDCMARFLIGRAFHVDMPDLPAPFEITDVTDASEQLRQTFEGGVA